MIFDLSTASRSEPKISSTYPYSSSSNQRQFRAEKIGPSYNKRVVRTPDDELLAPTPRFENFFQSAQQNDKKGGAETKIWINPKFDTQGNVVDSQTPDLESQESVPSRETSVWALEGPQETDASGGESIAMQDIGIDLSPPGLGRPRGRMEKNNNRLQEVWKQKELPFLPTGPESRGSI
jgi:hypothetical protein